MVKNQVGMVMCKYSYKGTRVIVLVDDSSRLSLIWMGLYTFTYVCVDSSQC